MGESEISRFRREPPSALALVLLLCLIGVGCGSSSKQYVMLEDVDGRLASQHAASPVLNAFHDADQKDGPDREDYQVTWVNLCKKDSCDPVAQKYSDLFRQVAVTVATLRQIEFVADAVASGEVSLGEARSIMEFGTRAVPALKDRVLDLKESLGALDPMADFSSKPALAPRAASGAATAAMQVKDAVTRLPDVVAKLGKSAPDEGSQTAIASADGDDATISNSAVSAPKSAELTDVSQPATQTVDLKLHPALDDRLEQMRGELARHPEYAPGGELTRDEVIRLATARGLAELERDLGLLRQFDNQSLLLLAVLKGETAAVETWFEERRSAAEGCVPEEVGSADLIAAGLHDSTGELTGVQAIVTTFSSPVTACLVRALDQGRLSLSEERGGTFEIRLTTETPEIARYVEESQAVAATAVEQNDPPADETMKPNREMEEKDDEPAARSELSVQPAGNEESAVTPGDTLHRENAPEPRRGGSAWTIGGIITGAALGISAIATGVSARGIRTATSSAIEHGTITEVEALERQDRFNTLRTAAWGLGAAGVALGGTSLVLHFVGGSKQSVSLNWSGQNVAATFSF